jgi:hypothetical protein
MLRAISTFALFTAPIIGLAVPLYVLVRSIRDFRPAKKGRVYIVLKALAALFAWFLASWGMFFMLFITFYTARNPDHEANEKHVALLLIFLSIVYALIGCGIAFWVEHKSDNEPIRIFPEGAT